MLAHHLAGIHLFLREDEEATAVLQLVNSVSKRRPRFHGDNRAVHAAGDFALPRLVVKETVGHDSLARTGREHISAQPDDTARGDFELKVNAVVLCFHRDHFALATRHHVNHLAGIFLRHIDGE